MKNLVISNKIIDTAAIFSLSVGSELNPKLQLSINISKKETSFIYQK